MHCLIKHCTLYLYELYLFPVLAFEMYMSIQIIFSLYCHSARISKKRPAKEFISRIEPIIVPRLFEGLLTDDETKKEVVEKFKQFYFQGKTSDEEIILAAIDVSIFIFQIVST